MDQSAIVPGDIKTHDNISQLIEAAGDYVASIRNDDMRIVQVEYLGEGTRQDIGAYVDIRVSIEDGGYYNLVITFQHEQVIDVEYICPNADIADLITH
jgi:hypothetical protein